MTWLKRQLDNLPRPDTIVHLGAGLCAELDQWLGSHAQRIVLVEPNLELLPELRARTEDHDSVEIISAAISGQSGRGALRLFNFPLLASLREPTGLYQILPGLRQIGRAMVETVTVGQLLEDLGLNAEGDHWLIIDTPGEEATIVDLICQSGGSQPFSRIFLSAGIEPMYQGTQSAQELLRLLQSHGIEPAGAPDPTDADWPRYHLRLDRMALECQRLKAELADQKQRENSEFARKQEDLQKLQSKLSAAEKEANILRQQNAELEQSKRRFEEEDRRKEALKEKFKRQLQAAQEKEKIEKEALAEEVRRLKQASAEAQKQLDATRAERDALKKSLEEEKSQAEQLAKERQAELEKQQKAWAELEKQLKATQDAAASEHQALTEELKQLKQASAEAQKQLDATRAERDALKKSLEEEKSQAEQLAKERQAELEKQQKAWVELEKQLKATQHAAASEHQALTEELKQLKQASGEAQKQLDATRAERDGLKGQLEQHVEQVESLKHEISEAKQESQHSRSDLAVALRLQTLRENDLAELQKRYGKLQETNQQQRELLGKLHQRLSAAAEYLQLAQDNSAGQLEVQEGLVKALTGEHQARD